MMIGVNGRFLTKPYTGIGQYTRHLFNELALQNPDDIILIVTPKKVDIDFIDNVEVVVLKERFPGTAGMRKTFWEQFQVPRYFKKRGVDIAHFPYPSNPWRGFNKPVVLTVHDTIPWTLTEYRKSFSTRLYQSKTQRAVAKADKIITVSNSSKKDIAEVCEIEEERIDVIYIAPSKAFNKKLLPARREKVLKKYKIPTKKPFFLYAGGYDDRKNVRFIVDVFLVEISDNFNVDLVLVGAKSLTDAFFDDLTNPSENYRLKSQKGNVIFTDFVEEKDFPALYQSAFAFLNLSKKEGFNLPLVEAAYSRNVIITSDLPVHHEVIGDHAIFCSPDDSNQLAVLMKKLLLDSAFYKKQKQKVEGFLRSYSWETAAKKLMTLYKSFL
jgi:glycosyltransferase involved in cell wall biosynthesis